MEQAIPAMQLTIAELAHRLCDDPDRVFNLELARRVVLNDGKAVVFYWENICSRITTYIGLRIMQRDVTGEHYTFLSMPLTPETDSPSWRRVSLYRAQRNSTLRTYTAVISVRYFCKLAKREKKVKNLEYGLLEFVDYEALLRYDCEAENIAEPSEAAERVHQAFDLLKERDKAVLKYLVIDDLHWSDAFVLLRNYLNPLGPDKSWEHWSAEEKQQAIDRYWTPKQKQDAMAGLKKRALAHLARRMEKLKSNSNK